MQVHLYLLYIRVYVDQKMRFELTLPIYEALPELEMYLRELAYCAQGHGFDPKH